MTGRFRWPEKGHSAELVVYDLGPERRDVVPALRGLPLPRRAADDALLGFTHPACLDRPRPSAPADRTSCA
ncbi:hypothetical protein ACFCZ1_22285 [Streptomyces sp. NPDC056224]|uniref:hypothetical protein n=1 Tax=Streptomyces sp. NPDC056224 TaxID=3345750 RepID=UPI0035D8548E